MKKKVLVTLLAAAMVLGTAGCGGSEGKEDSQPVEVSSVDDLADLTIGVQIGTTGDSQATEAVNEDSQVNRFNTDSK